jgi:hypothetical protein
MFMSCHHDVGKNLKIANKSFKKAVRYKYLEMTVTNQNYIHKKFKSRLTSETACGTQFRIINLSTTIKAHHLLDEHETFISKRP